MRGRVLAVAGVAALAGVVAGAHSPAVGLQLLARPAPVTQLAIDPRAPWLVYAGTSSGVFKSTNGGSSWHDTGSGLGFVDAVAVSPTDPDTVYAGAHGLAAGFWRSVDRGRTWTSSGVHPDWFADVLAVAAGSRDGDVVYAGTGVLRPSRRFAALYRSTDGGRSWTPAARGLEGTPKAIVVDPVHRQVLYAATSLGLFRSDDRGSSWARRWPHEETVFTATIAPTASVLYASGRRGVYRSTDEGVSWRRVGPRLASGAVVTSLAVGPRSDQSLFAAAPPGRRGVYRSFDGGLTWYHVLSENIHGLHLEGLDRITSLALDPKRPWVFVSTWNGGVWRSRDGGWHYAPSSTGLPTSSSS